MKDNKRGAQGTVRDYPTKQGKRWAYVYDAGRKPDGTRRQISRKGFKSKTEAQNALTKQFAEILDNTAIKPDEVTFAEYFIRWIERQGALKIWASTTRQASRERAQYAIRMFGKLKLQQLTTERIETDLLWLHQRGGLNERPISAKTIHNIAQLVSQCLEEAVVREKIKKNPARGVRLPKMPRKKIVNMPTPEQFEDLLYRTEGTRYHAMIALAAQCGLRRAELLALQWTDIDFRIEKVMITKSLVVTREGGFEIKPTKSERDRMVRLAPGTIDALLRHRDLIERDKDLLGAGYRDNGLVFCTPEGDYYSPAQITNRITEFMAKAGFKSSIHKLRHFAGSFLVSRGMPLPAVAEILGHSDSTITQRYYTHTMPGDNEMAAVLWQNEFGKSEPPRKKPLTVMPPAYVTTDVTANRETAPKLLKVKG